MSSKHLKAGDVKPAAVESGKMRLYSMLYCPYAQRSRLVLAAKNIEYETVNINLQRRPDWFTEMNPAGTVPFLELPDGQSLGESLIICDYLDERFPENQLSHKDPYAKARGRLLVDKFANLVIPNCWIFYKTPEKLNEVLEVFEKTLESDFFGGELPLLHDYMMYPWMQRLILHAHQGFTFEKLPKLEAWIQRMQQRDEVRVTIVPPERMQTFLESKLAAAVDNSIDVKYDF